MDDKMNALKIRDLHFKYKDGRPGLAGVNLDCTKGSKVCLIGKNGSGKTTLLLNINCLLNGSGIIEVMGLRRSKQTAGEIRKKTGLLFSQVEHQFIMPDLINDILLGTSGDLAGREKAIEIIKYFNLEKYSAKNPLELSAGEMKRAALAGILVREPELLLLDEPLQNLDRENSNKLAEILNSLEMTMLIATHSRFVVENIADHVAVMDSGKISGYYSRDEAVKRKDVNDLLL